jgi:hypothetical protein
VTAESFEAAFVSRETDNIENPAVLESMETYMFIGFDAVTAKTLWERYSTATEAGDDEDPEGGFLDFPRLIIENGLFPDTTSGVDD